MNILATHHPDGKDYGHMKVDEPKTPFPYDMELSGDLDPDELTSSLVNVGGIMSLPADLKPSSSEDDDSTRQSFEDDEGGEEHDDEDIHRNPGFEKKRRAHYNEFQAAKLAKKLLARELPLDTNKGGDEDKRLKEAEANAKKNTQTLSNNILNTEYSPSHHSHSPTRN